jgi:hypothetical protein
MIRRILLLIFLSVGGYLLFQFTPKTTEPIVCSLPVNSYEPPEDTAHTQGTTGGHYAGFEFRNNTDATDPCSLITVPHDTDFEDGCREYERQQEEYEYCESRKVQAEDQHKYRALASVIAVGLLFAYFRDRK